MKKTNSILQKILYSSLAISIIMVVLFECDIIESGILAADGRNEFIVAIIMELITICSIPVVLRMFKFGFVKRSVCSDGDISLRKWNVLRMSLLCILMIINTLLYYLFMNVAFGYMGIIIFLCTFLIFPTMERLKKEKEECER